MAEGSVVAICQYGGEFVTNGDGSLSYSGGEAHAIEVPSGMPFDDLKSELRTIFNLDMSTMSFKYFLPSNRRTLITISSDKDIQRMVDFNANASSTEVYIVNKVDNRINRSTIADSGTSTVATEAEGSGGKRKRLHSNHRATKVKIGIANSDKSAATSNEAGQNTSMHFQLGIEGKESLAAEMADNRSMEAGLTLSATALVTVLDTAEERLTTIDNIDERLTGSMLVDPDTPFMASLSIPEDIQPLNSNYPWVNLITGVGQEFDNVKDFRTQLCKYAISKGFAYKFVKNETSRVTVKCRDQSCPWRLHASESSQKQKFVIKKMNNVHTCGGSRGGQRRATRQWLTGIIKEKLYHSPDCKPKDLARELYEEFGVALSYSQVWRGREVAQKELFTIKKETFNQLPWFCEKILETNPGSVAILSTSTDSKFRRFFVAYYASLHGFEHGCHPLVFLDRIPLKASNQFKLLTAATVDGNDTVFPIAFSVVEDENYDSWLWFLLQLKFAITNTRIITFISDRHKGLEDAVPQVFEDSHHSYCLHHLIEDFKNELRKGPWSQHLKEAMADDFTRAAQACTVEDFNKSLDSIRSVSEEAAEWVIASKPDHWSDALFGGSRYDHFSSNIADSFTNWIPVKQESSIIQIVNALRCKLTSVIEERRESCNTWTGTLTPAMEQKLQKEESKARKFTVLCSSDTVFEVRGNTIFVVNIGTGECTCRRWQISGLPCTHAVAVFHRIGRSVYDYCSRYFRIEYYQLIYSASVYPLPDVSSIDFNLGASLYPPPARRQPGKPRRKRFNPNKISTVVRVCSRCKVAGHNKATCEAIF